MTMLDVNIILPILYLHFKIKFNYSKILLDLIEKYHRLQNLLKTALSLNSYTGGQKWNGRQNNYFKSMLDFIFSPSSI